MKNQKSPKDSLKGVTPNKQIRRGGDPSPVKPFRLSGGAPKAMTYKKGR